MSAPTAHNSTRDRERCMPVSERDKHFCNTRLARMACSPRWFRHLEDCTMRALFSIFGNAKLLIQRWIL